MRFFLPEQWEENGDGVCCGPFIYLGKVVTANPYPMSGKGEFDLHRYFHYCTRYLVYEQATIVDDAISLGPLTVHEGLRPFGSHRNMDAVTAITYECFDDDGPGIFKKGMLYDSDILWAEESGDGVPVGVSRKKLCDEGRTPTEFKLKSNGVIGSSFWWSPASYLPSLWSDFKSRYPACISEGDTFCLVFYCECWAGRLFTNWFNPDVEAPRDILEKEGEEAVDLWVTALFM